MTTIASTPVLPPPTWDEMSLFEQLSTMPPDVSDGILKDLVSRGVDPYGFEVILRPNQLDIVKDHESWISLFSAGRGAGKSLSGAGWVDERARKFPGCRIILLGRTVADVRDVMINGDSGIVSKSSPDFMPVYTPSRRIVEWPNGSTATTFSADTPSQLRGPQGHFTWCLSPGTMVRTPSGEVPIETISVGDVVSTIQGPRKVIATGSREANLYKLKLVNGRFLEGSAEHPVATERGWVPLSNVSAANKVFTWANESESALIAETVSLRKFDPEEKDLLPTIAVEGAATPVGRRGYVYNLTVEGSHHFFANGILTHNCDELAAFPTVPDTSGATAWDNCLMATRLGDRPQILVTTTPKRTGVMRELYRMADTDPLVVLHQASTLSNRANLSAGYIESIFNKYGGTHLEQQELYGALVGDAPGALWRASDIVIGKNEDPDVKTIKVIGVDPSVEAGGDNTGIVLAEATIDREMINRRAWVLEDRTMEGSPDQWAAQVHSLWKENPGSIVVVEGNQGGQLLRMVLHQLDASMPVAIVKAIRSKAMRAEPIVMAYRQGRVEHVQHFPLLEEEMTGWEPGVSRWSPGSVDAVVWALTTLLVDESPLYPYTPLIFSPPSKDKVPILVPKYRDERKSVGMGLAPWRRRR